MLTTVLAFVLAAAPIKIDPPAKVDAPKLDFKLPEVPKAEGLTGPSKDEQMQSKTTANDLRATIGGPTSAPAKVEQVIHAKDFTAAKNGYTPSGRIEAFSLAAVPARIGPFKTCVRVASADGVPVSLRAQLKTPSGVELLSSRADVTFGTASSMDVIIEWEGFEATHAGAYKVAVILDGKPAGEFPLQVQAK